MTVHYPNKKIKNSVVRHRFKYPFKNMPSRTMTHQTTEVCVFPALCKLLVFRILCIMFLGFCRVFPKRSEISLFQRVFAVKKPVGEPCPFRRAWLFIGIFALLALSASFGCRPNGRESAQTGEKAANRFESAEALNDPSVTMGVPLGARSDSVLSKKFAKANFKRFSSVADGILAVKTGKIDLFGFDRSILGYAAAKNSDLTILPDFSEQGPLVIGASPKNQTLLDRVNDYIRQYRADGTYADMERRWIRGEEVTMPDIPEAEHPDGTLTVGSEGVCEPMNFRDASGKIIGFDIEFAKRLALFLNKKLEIVSPTWDGLILGTSSGKIDLLIANLNRTENLKGALRFSDEYVKSEIVLLVRKDRIAPNRYEERAAAPSANESEKDVGICRLGEMLAGFGIDRPTKAEFDEMMRHARIAVTVGSILEGFARTDYPESDVLPFDTYPDLVPALLKDRADAVYSSYSSMFVFLNKYRDSVRCVESTDRFDDVGIAFRKDSAERCQAANERLRAYEKQGALQNLGRKWFTTPDKYPSFYRQRAAADAPVWTIATSPDREPMIFIRDGEVDGFDAELIRRIADDLGLRVQFSQMKFASLIPALLAGKSDAVISSLSITPARQEKVLFSRPYLRNNYIALARRNFADRFFPLAEEADRSAQGEYSTLDELAGRQVAVLSGSMFDQVLRERVPTAIPRYYPDIASMIAATQASKTDGFLVDSPSLRLILKRHPHLVAIDERLVNYDYGYALPKTEKHLADELSDFITQCQADGTCDKLETKWSEGEEEDKVISDGETDGPNGRIRFAYIPDEEPFSYRKGETPLGLEVELIRLFAASRGYALELTAVPFESLLASVAAKKFQIAGGCITITPERQQSLLFSRPFYHGGAVLVVRARAASSSDGEAAAKSPGFWKELETSFRRTLLQEGRWKMVLRGLGMTLLLTGLSAFFGTLLAFPLCGLRRAKNRFAAKTAALIIYLVRGTPLVVFLMVLYYIVFVNFKISAVAVATVGFSINFAAYFAEMLRSSIDAIDRGEIEAAEALGFSRFGIIRCLIFPQAVRYVMPMYKGEVVALLKATAIVGYIAVEDLTKASDIIRSRTYEAFFPLILTTLIYLAVAWILIRLLSQIEFRVDPALRSRHPKGVTERP